VVVLLIMGIAFYSKVQGRNADKLAQKAQDLAVIELAKTASELPEFKCFTQDVAKVNCFDYYKILAFNATIREPGMSDYYYNYFKSSRITFQQIYPEEWNITIYNYNISAQRSLIISIPILIEKNLGRSDVQDGFGFIIVEGYYK
jgi:hypothetical protein